MKDPHEPARNGVAECEPQPHLSPSKILAGAVIAVVLATWLMWPTIPPDLVLSPHGGDAPELILAAATAGVAHPSGYPFWVLFGNLFCRLPWGTLAWRLHVFSAVSIILAAGFLSMAMAGLAQRLRIGCPTPVVGVLGSAGVLHVSGWLAGTMTEVYAFKALLGALFLAAVLLPVLAQRRDSVCLRLVFIGICWGMWLGHHLSAFFFVPGALWLIVWGHRPSVRQFLMTSLVTGGTVVGCWGLLPLLASQENAVVWGDFSHVSGWWEHVTGSYYHSLMGSPLSWSWISDLPREMWSLLSPQWSPIAWVWLGVGALWALVGGSKGEVGRKRRIFVVGWFVLWVVPLMLIIRYDVPDRAIFLTDLLTCLSLAFLLSCGFLVDAMGSTNLSDRVRARQLAWLVTGLMAVSLVPGLLARGKEISHIRGPEPVIAHTRAMTRMLPDRGIALARHGGVFFLLRYHEFLRDPSRARRVLSYELCALPWYRRQTAAALSAEGLPPWPDTERFGFEPVREWLQPLWAEGTELVRLAVPPLPGDRLGEVIFQHGWFRPAGGPKSSLFAPDGRAEPPIGPATAESQGAGSGTRWISPIFSSPPSSPLTSVSASLQGLRRGWNPCRVAHADHGSIALTFPRTLSTCDVVAFPQPIKRLCLMGFRDGGSAAGILRVTPEGENGIKAASVELSRFVDVERVERDFPADLAIGLLQPVFLDLPKASDRIRLSLVVPAEVSLDVWAIAGAP
jgi:hypothetical protein